jgi:6-phosphogluconolactonase
MKLIDRINDIEHPSFLTIDQDQKILYAVSETKEVDGRQSGKVVSYRIHPKTGELTYLNEQLTLGAHPCYVSLNSQKRQLFAVNYSGGNICSFPIRANGEIGEITDLVQHEGSSIRVDRQSNAHPHSIIIDPSMQFAYVPDLGLDRIKIYQLTKDNKLNNIKDIQLQPGAGPRHLVFHPLNPYSYLINELDCTITVYSYTNDGSLTQLQNIPTLPQPINPKNTGADIHILPSGRFLYGSIRGDNSIFIYQINQENGHLTFVDKVSTRGNNPRNFSLSPDGRILVVANQSSDSIISFEIDQETGKLSEPRDSLHVSEPVCIQFLRHDKPPKSPV